MPSAPVGTSQPEAEPSRDLTPNGARSAQAETTRPRRVRFAMATAALVLSLLAGGLLSTPASAYQTTSYGRAGAVVPYKVETRSKLVTDRGVSFYKPGLSIPAPVVYRPAGTNGVAMTFSQTIEILRWNGSRWVFTTSVLPQTRGIAAGSQWNYGVSFHTSLGGGYYTVRIATAWSNGASSIVTMNGAGDYSCTIFASTCYPGYVFLTG